MEELTAEQKDKLRNEIAVQGAKLIGIPYEYGAEWTDYAKPPIALDCSELVEGIYKMVGLRMEDGAQNQFNFTVPTPNPQLSDLAFFGKNADPNKIYHVGLLFHMGNILEARGYDPSVKFETGHVILRPKQFWETWKNFVGYQSHPRLL